MPPFESVKPHEEALPGARVPVAILKVDPITRIWQTTRFEMPLRRTAKLAHDEQLVRICEGFYEAIDREVGTLNRERLPIYVAKGDRIIDVQRQEPR